MTTRTLANVIPSIPASDGAGVKLRRSLGSRRGLYHDPFLMLDEFYSDDPNDYLAGFPAHPHRGFETVTYMLDGHMRHEDNFGHRGDLGPGDVQWMTAAHGIIHSEMPQQTAGRMRGFQLWLNLPAAEKMQPADYRDIPSREIPSVALPGGVQVRVIAGVLGAVSGPVNGADARKTTDPLYLDLHLPAAASADIPLAAGRNAFLYAYEGEVRVGGQLVPHRAAATLGDGDAVTLTAGAQGARVLLLAARPLREPVVQYGPFVMNTHEQIEQAIADYQSGRLAAV
ncbi:MAG TPA: pirin family protein [Nevskiaceae bacterium]|nr:pirin family protein [Nevskiaceae bacterium]